MTESLVLKNNYKLEKILGQGGMGCVYLATDIKNNRKVAVKKILIPEGTSNVKELIDRFYREYLFLSEINHPNIIKSYDFFTQKIQNLTHINNNLVQRQYFMVLELAEGLTLKAFLEKKSNSLSLSEQLAICIQLGRAIEIINSAGIIHRDIKPMNIIIDNQKKRVKLLDLGIAKDLNHDLETLTNTGSLIGSPGYMSPEQIDGKIAKNSDVFSLGVVLYQFFLWRKESPFKASTLIATMMAVSTQELPPLHEQLKLNVADQATYAKLSNLISKAIIKDAKQRIISVSEFVYSLEKIYQYHLQNKKKQKTELWCPTLKANTRQMEHLKNLRKKYSRSFDGSTKRRDKREQQRSTSRIKKRTLQNGKTTKVNLKKKNLLITINKIFFICMFICAIVILFFFQNTPDNVNLKNNNKEKNQSVSLEIKKDNKQSRKIAILKKEMLKKKKKENKQEQIKKKKTLKDELAENKKKLDELYYRKYLQKRKKDIFTQWTYLDNFSGKDKKVTLKITQQKEKIENNLAEKIKKQLSIVAFDTRKIQLLYRFKSIILHNHNVLQKMVRNNNYLRKNLQNFNDMKKQTFDEQEQYEEMWQEQYDQFVKIDFYTLMITRNLKKLKQKYSILKDTPEGLTFSKDIAMQIRGITVIFKMLHKFFSKCKKKRKIISFSTNSGKNWKGYIVKLSKYSFLLKTSLKRSLKTSHITTKIYFADIKTDYLSVFANPKKGFDLYAMGIVMFYDNNKLANKYFLAAEKKDQNVGQWLDKISIKESFDKDIEIKMDGLSLVKGKTEKYRIVISNNGKYVRESLELKVVPSKNIQLVTLGSIESFSLKNSEKCEFFFNLKTNKSGSHFLKIKLFSSGQLRKKTKHKIKMQKKIAGFLCLGWRTYSCNNNSYRVLEYKHRQTGIEFIKIPTGTFQMGAVGKYDEKPIHQVNISSFLMAKYEITKAMWQKTMKSTPWSGQNNVEEGDDYAATHINWNKADEFCKKQGMRLPTEAEWEYACRSGSVNTYYWGNAIDHRYIWLYSNTYQAGKRYAHKVGQKLPNAFGLYDMSGNVRELCSDWYDKSYYSRSSISNPTGPKEGLLRSFRGGAWNSPRENCCSVTRYSAKPDARLDNLGFRPCVSLKE